LPFTGVKLEAFDGKGTMKGTGFSTVDGGGGSQTYTGTYSVNPDCTDTYSVTITPGDLQANAFFVIVDGGNELQVVIKDVGNVITCIAKQLYPDLDKSLIHDATFDSLTKRGRTEHATYKSKMGSNERNSPNEAVFSH
jgi:hypothetical protein